MPELKTKKILLAGTLIGIGVIISYIELGKPETLMQGGGQTVTVTPISSAPSTDGAGTTTDRTALLKSKAAKFPMAKELADIQGYINSPNGSSLPFTLSEFVGKKVILLDFWTYSCINCQRTTPYLNEWYSKYKDKGFVIVGVHSPEFDFEKKYDNVERAVRDAGIQYPNALDSNFGTWNAYNNHFWPHKYLIDIDGYVVYDHIGEGGYDETEAVIQKLLEERTSVLGDHMSVALPITVKHEDDIQTKSPETYFGSLRNEFLGTGLKGLSGEQYFQESEKVVLNSLYLVGKWNITPEYAESTETAGGPAVPSNRILYRYASKGLYFVAGSDAEMDVEVLRDGMPLDAGVKGVDVFIKEGRSYLRVSSTRLYKIVDDDYFGEHLIEFIVPKPGLKAFTFTFG